MFLLVFVIPWEPFRGKNNKGFRVHSNCYNWRALQFSISEVSRIVQEMVVAAHGVSRVRVWTAVLLGWSDYMAGTVPCVTERGLWDGFRGSLSIFGTFVSKTTERAWEKKETAGQSLRFRIKRHVAWLSVSVCARAIEAYVCTVVMTLWSAITSSSIQFYMYSFSYIISTTSFYFLELLLLLCPPRFVPGVLEKTSHAWL